jgi:hypothetical protein
MKKIVLLMAIVSSTLMSCDSHEKVKLSNGAYIDAINNTNINYDDFDDVCVQNSQGKWYICSDGEFRDTTVVGASGGIKHRTGRVMTYN